ncbi:MAG: RNA polymerase subunit sigma, partial [Variovorax paradoxus]
AAHLGVSETRVKQYLAKVLLHCHARLFPDGAAAS